MAYRDDRHKFEAAATRAMCLRIARKMTGTKIPKNKCKLIYIRKQEAKPNEQSNPSTPSTQ